MITQDEFNLILSLRPYLRLHPDPKMIDNACEWQIDLYPKLQMLRKEMIAQGLVLNQTQINRFNESVKKVFDIELE